MEITLKGLIVPMKQFIKSLIPPILFSLLKRMKPNKHGWKGIYNTWEEAKKISIGYNNEKILQKVRNSLLKVKNKEAVFERDSVIFDKIQYSWPLLAGLMYACAKSKGKLRVLDFGGSLGSTYFQNKKFLDCFDEVSWSIVEQKHFVDVGKNDFQDSRLHFYYDIETCKKEQNPNILVLSSVLQYIEKPYELMESILKNNFDFILIDRTPFAKKKQIKLQIVPPQIYDASYPCWFFEENELLLFLKNQGYAVVEEYDALDGKCEDYYFKGYILKGIK